MTAATVTPFEVALPAMAGARAGNSLSSSIFGGAQNSSNGDEASQPQIAFVQEMSDLMLGCALELQCLAAELLEESHGEAGPEVARAREQAQLLRCTADQVRMELSAAPAGPLGKRKISASRLASITACITTIMTDAASEKSNLVKEIGEVKEHAIIAAKPAPSLSTCPSPFSGIERVTRTSTAAVVAAPVIEATGHASWFSHSLHAARGALEHPVEMAASLWQATRTRVGEVVESISNSGAVKTLAKWRESVVTTTLDFVESPLQTTKTLAKACLPAPVVDALRATRDGVKRTYHAAVDGVSHGFRAVADTVAHGMETGYNAAVDAKNRLVASAEQLKTAAAEKLARTKEFVRGYWPFGKEETKLAEAKPESKPTVAKKPEEPTLSANMARAMRQATAAAASIATLPMALGSHSVSDIFSFSAPVLPKLNAAISHLSGLH